MENLSIELRDYKKDYRPGETIEGEIRWNLISQPESLELSLFWYTKGKGTQDIKIIRSIKIDSPGASGSKTFTFNVPDGPYSFSGTLISLMWAIELVAYPDKKTCRAEMVVSPTEQEIQLRPVLGDKKNINSIL